MAIIDLYIYLKFDRLGVTEKVASIQRWVSDEPKQNSKYSRLIKTR